jgi:hypothetical protein
MKRHWTAWPSLLLFLTLLSCLALTLCPKALPAGAGEPSAAPGLDRLIEDLGSMDFEVREAASRALVELDEAPAALRRALGSPDLEIRRRAADAIDGIEQRRALRGLTRAWALAKEGRIVEAAERIVAFARRDSQGLGGQALTEFVARLVEQLPRERLKKNSIDPPDDIRGFPSGDFRRWLDIAHPKEIFSGKHSFPPPHPQVQVFARGDEVTLDAQVCDCSLILASGDVRSPAAFVHHSVIVAGGDVVLKKGGATQAVIICDGSVEVSGADNCLIVARGKVPGPPTVRLSLVRTGTGTYIAEPGRKNLVLLEDTPDPFAFVKFFELSDVGLTVAERDGQGEAVRDGVCIQEVRKGALFASTLQAGDVVTAIDGTKATAKEDFRRLLRKRLARGGPRLTFTVRRAGQTSEVAVPVKD